MEDDILDEMDNLLNGDIVIDIMPKEEPLPIVEPEVEPPKKSLIDEEMMKRFEKETVFPENYIFSEPVVTTVTIGAFFDGIKFHEKELIEQLEPNEKFSHIKCNFGTKIHEGFELPLQKKTSNRGRKKQKKKQTNRKKQGDGSSLNTQITFTARPGDKIYKIKLFRNGFIQLPGLKKYQHIKELIELTFDLAKFIEPHMEGDVHLKRLEAIMKNYKFKIAMEEGYIVNLQRLSDLLDEWNDNPDRGDYPRIFEVKYSKQNTITSL